MLNKALSISLLSGLALAASLQPAAAQPGDLLRFKTTLDISSFRGTTFFNFMTANNGVKNWLDYYANNGFKIAGADAISNALRSTDNKVARGALRSLPGGEQALRQLADGMAAKDAISTYVTLPDQISAASQGRGDKYDLATFFSLASGGGVAVKLDDNNYYYNVGYGTGKRDKDEMTGRSFGKGPNHEANDASDAFYLGELEDLIRSTPDSSEFFRSIMQTITSCHTVNFAKMSPLAQTVATDFLAIYTAEQDRHLMDGLRSHPWDNDLFEVTLLSAFSAGGSKVLVEVDGQLTDSFKDDRTGQMRPASLVNWWRKSEVPGSNRSGIGESRDDRKRLTSAITNFERQHNPQLVQAIEAAFVNFQQITGRRLGGDVFQELTGYLVNFRAPTSLGVQQPGNQAFALTEAFVAFLDQVRKDADQIAQYVQGGGR